MSDDINVVSLSKGVYDSMRETNSRAKLLLDEMMDIRNVKLSEDENSIEFSQRAINDAMRVLFNDTYNRKLGAPKMKRTKEMLGK